MNEILAPAPAVQPETTEPDKTLVNQLADLRKYQRAVETLTAFLAVHHEKLRGISWAVWPILGNPHIHVRLYHPHLCDPAEIARRFPGEWKTGLKSDDFNDSLRDWTAERDGVVIRILGAERIAPETLPVRVTTF